MTTRTPDIPAVLLAAALTLAILGAAGCSAKYQHEDLALDGEVAGKIVALVDSLRKSASDAPALQALVRDQIAPGLPPATAAALEPALTELAKANDVKLSQIDRFGKILRVGFRVTGPEAPEPKEYLFLLTNDASPRWIGLH